MLDLDKIEILPPKRPLVVTLDVWPEEVELALASNGNSLRRGLMLALIATMAVETDHIAEPLARFLPWHDASPDLE